MKPLSKQLVCNAGHSSLILFRGGCGIYSRGLFCRENSMEQFKAI